MTDTITTPYETEQLPPDPEGKNDDRACWAAAALRAFIAQTGTDELDALPDLLADLMHWCDRSGFDFDFCLQRGRDHYEVETASEEEAA